MGSIKLKSFSSFAHSHKIDAAAKLEEEKMLARNKAADKFKALLNDFNVTSIKELKEDDKKSFFSKLGNSEISESLAIIEEGTRSQIGKIKKNGKITSVYMHYDGYPENMLPIIKKGYKDGKAVDLLLKKGGGSGLEVDPLSINFYGDKTTIDGNMKDTEKYVKDAANNGGAEFIYLYSEKESKWYMVDIYDSYDLVPAFESIIINEAFKPSKGNARDAKKVSKFLNTFFMKHSAIANSESFLGACRYLLAESLTDANFHSYRDPVSKALGGKISTIMVDVESLGGMSLPIGKKTLMNLLDEHYSGVASAAGWSGIGIVEGMALFLDGFGYSQPAQKIVDAFELIWANESVMNEGNAFLAARAKAIEEDAEEFEFNGKKFPVIKEDLEIEEVTEGDTAKVSKKEIQFHLDAFEKGDIEGEDLAQAIGEILYGKLRESDKAQDPGEEVPGGKVSDETEEQFPDDFDATNPAEKGKMTNEEEEEVEEAEVTEARAKYVNTQKTVDGNPLISFNSSTTRAKWIDKNKSNVISVPDSTVINSDQGRVVGSSRGPYYLIVKADVLEESKVEEAKFVKDFDKDVLDAETKADITTYYPSAKFFMGKMTHFFGELEPNLFFKAYYAKYYKEDTGKKIDGEFKITSIYSEKGRNYVHLYNESAQPTNEAEVKSDEEFKEYAFTVLGKAFGDKFDEEKAQEVVDGLLSKHGGDYGAAVGALTASLG
jgi:hypothetical protein